MAELEHRFLNAPDRAWTPMWRGHFAETIIAMFDAYPELESASYNPSQGHEFEVRRKPKPTRFTIEVSEDELSVFKEGHPASRSMIQRLAEKAKPITG